MALEESQQRREATCERQVKQEQQPADAEEELDRLGMKGVGMGCYAV